METIETTSGYCNDPANCDIGRQNLQLYTDSQDIRKNLKTKVIDAIRKNVQNIIYGGCTTGCIGYSHAYFPPPSFFETSRILECSLLIRELSCWRFVLSMLLQYDDFSCSSYPRFVKISFSTLPCKKQHGRKGALPVACDNMY